jgi:hypothetical protein
MNVGERISIVTKRGAKVNVLTKDVLNVKVFPI